MTKRDPLKSVARYADAARTATERRDEAIAEARAAGMTLRAIGEAAGLSHVAVDKIVARTTAGA